MYSLDINFLKDRAAVSAPAGGKAAKAAPKRKVTAVELLPAFIGAGVGALALLAAGGVYLYVGWQKTQTQAQISTLEGEIAALEEQQRQIEQLEAQVAAAQQQTTGLAQIFSRILPWSAIIEDVRARIPAGVQLVSFNVTETAVDPTAPAAAPAPAPAADPNAPVDPNAPPAAAAPVLPMPTIEFSGYAAGYDQVNYFLIALQRSAFMDGETLRITAASLVDDPNSLEAAAAEGQAATPADVTLPKVVQYQIKGQVRDLTEIPSDQLITQLENKKNMGSVIRLRALQERGIL